MVRLDLNRNFSTGREASFPWATVHRPRVIHSIRGISAAYRLEGRNIRLILPELMRSTALLSSVRVHPCQLLETVMGDPESPTHDDHEVTDRAMNRISLMILKDTQLGFHISMATCSECETTKTLFCSGLKQKLVKIFTCCDCVVLIIIRRFQNIPRSIRERPSNVSAHRRRL